jgi:hypothetical protein
MTRRATTTVPWGTPVQVTELDTPGADNPTWISPDGCRLYFESNEGPGGAQPWYDLFVAARGQ